MLVSNFGDPYCFAPEKFSVIAGEISCFIVIFTNRPLNQGKNYLKCFMVWAKGSITLVMNLQKQFYQDSSVIFDYIVKVKDNVIVMTTSQHCVSLQIPYFMLQFFSLNICSPLHYELQFWFSLNLYNFHKSSFGVCCTVAESK